MGRVKTRSLSDLQTIYVQFKVYLGLCFVQPIRHTKFYSLKDNNGQCTDTAYVSTQLALWMLLVRQQLNNFA